MIRLFFNYYEDKNLLRKKEIDECLKNNQANPLLTVITFTSQSKPKYDLFFQKINEITGPEDINIICNSDIYFDNTIELANKIQHKQVYALSRWDVIHPWKIVHFDRQDSQDTWVVRGRVDGVFGDFTLGIRGCDNRIAYEFNKAGYTVSNPSKSIKSYHLHKSNIRNYIMSDVVPQPYLTIKPSSL
jgi:hypothetical protein